VFPIYTILPHYSARFNRAIRSDLPKIRPLTWIESRIGAHLSPARAALRRSKTVLLFCHILIAMNIGRLIQGIIRCQTCRLAAETTDVPIVSAIR
jgi:hypothetical protein